MQSIVAVTLTGLAMLSDSVYADGYRMANGRYASGPTTVLELTSKQVTTTRTGRVVVLDPLQQATLKAAAGVAPTVLSIESLAVAGTDCTCNARNFAIWIQPTAIEVPHSFLVSDTEAEQFLAEDEAFLAAEAEERKNAVTDAFLATVPKAKRPSPP